MARLFRVLALALVVLASVSAFSQATSGDLIGTVQDKSGAVVPNATVVATNEATNVKTTATTNASGEYRLANLLPGSYSLNVTAKGFGASTVKGVVVELNRTVTQRVTVDVGQVATTVEVNEGAPPIDTTTAQIQTTYDLKQSADLPVAAAGSGVLNLSLLQAGVGSSGGIGAGSGPSVGGQRPRNNNFTIEGVDVNDKGVTGPDVNIPNDATQNFTILQNQYSPEFGHSTGGQFNRTVIGGTNSWHGRAYEYFQNRNLNAIDVSNKRQGLKENPRYDNNRFGGQIGGPILRDKLFFFFNYEYNPIGQAATPSANVYAPTAAGYTTLAGIASVYQPNVNQLKTYAQAAAPCTGASDPGCPLVQRPGAAVCTEASRATNCIAVGNIPIVAPNFTNNKALVSSLDFNVSNRDQVRARYIYNQSASVDTGATLPAFFTNQITPAHLFTLSEFHTFSPTVTNELRVGYMHFGQTFAVGNQTWPGLDQFPNAFLEDLNLNLGPDPNAPQFAIQGLYQLTDNMTWIKGNHTFKFGIDTAEYISPQSFTQRSRGDYDYTDSSLFFTDQVPDDLAERSLGNNVYYGNNHWFYGFLNDNWKLRPNLTVNLGLRYEYQGIPLGWNKQALNKVANAPGLITFNAPVPPLLDFAPRIGFAWSPGSSATWSVRGGFGMGYDILYDNIGVLTIPPQLGQTSDCPGGPGCGPNNAFLRNGGIKPFSGVPVLTASFCANVIGVTVADDTHCARLLTAAHLPNTGPPSGDVKYPQSYQWNLGVQHQFLNSYTFESRYVGTAGVHLNVQNRLNKIASVDSTHFLPLFMSAPSASQIAALTTTLSGLRARYTSTFGGVGFDPAFAAAGFNLVNIVGFEPYGHSSYHGWANQLNRRFTNGLMFQVAYTWSHTIDNSTADFFSTVLSPRRPEDFRNLQKERSNSALDRNQRFNISLIYDVPWFKKSNWFAHNVIGNWQFSPVYTYETGEWANIQSGQDANLNGDAAGDRVVINPSGNKALGSDVTAVTNTAGATVGYVVRDPNAYWIRARQGMLTTSTRNTWQLPAINNVDLSIIKRFAVTERASVEFSTVALNVLNHAQYVGGVLNDIRSIGQTGAAATTLLQPQGTNFLKPALTFPSNARSLVLGLKFIF